MIVLYSLRLTVCSELTDEELRRAAYVINEALEKEIQ